MMRCSFWEGIRHRDAFSYSRERGKERGSEEGVKGGTEKGRVGKRDSGCERERKRGREVNVNRKEMTTHMLLLHTYVHVLCISTHFKNNIPLLELS